MREGYAARQPTDIGPSITGDFCDLHIPIVREMDHNILALIDCDVDDIPPEAINALTEEDGRLGP